MTQNFFTIYYREPFGIVHTVPTVSYGGQPCGSIQRCKSAVRAYAGQSQHFKG